MNLKERAMRIYKAPSIKLSDLQRKVYSKAKHANDRRIVLYCKNCDTQVVGLGPMIEHVTKVRVCK